MRAVWLLVVAFAAMQVGCRPPGYGKDEKPDAAESTVDAGPTGDASIDTPAAATCDHAFRLDGHGTDSSVWLTGDFVQWASAPPTAIEFVLGLDGGWTGSYAFAAGTHQYKFIVNGNNWILDPTNGNTIDDGMGHTNNVYVCVP